MPRSTMVLVGMVASLVPTLPAALAQNVPSSASTASRPPSSNLSPEELRQRETWGKSMAQHSSLRSGCFQAQFPSQQWEEVPCINPPPRPFGSARGHVPFAVGNGADYSANSPAAIASATGSFWETDGLTSETGAAGASNSFSLQLNTNNFNSAACSTAA